MIERSRLTVDERWRRQRTLPDDARRQALACEHESAHAIVGDAMGLRVGWIQSWPDGSGNTEVDGGGRAQWAATLVAPGVWLNVLRAEWYPQGDVAGCRSDMARLAGVTDRFGAQQAARVAGRVLRERREMVLDLAERLLRDQAVYYDQWKRERL